MEICPLHIGRIETCDPSNDGTRARNFLVWRFCVRADLYHNETIKKVPPLFCLETWTVKLFNENDVHVYWESYDHYILKDEVLLTVSCPIFPSILIAKNLLTGRLKINW